MASNASPTVVGREARISATVALRMQGLRYTEIAEQLGIHTDTVGKHLRTARDEWRSERIEDYDRIRGEILARFDETIAEAMRSHGREPDPRYLAVVVTALDKMARLLGMYDATPGSDGELPEIDRTSDRMSVEQARLLLPGPG